MIEQVSFAKTTFRQPPERFEAGTPNISGAIGLAAAIEFLDSVGWELLFNADEPFFAIARSYESNADSPSPQSTAAITIASRPPTTRGERSRSRITPRTAMVTATIWMMLTA